MKEILNLITGFLKAQLVMNNVLGERIDLLKNRIKKLEENEIKRQGN